MSTKDLDHENLLKNYPKVRGVMPKQVWDGIKDADNSTQERLGDLWRSNIDTNLEKYLPKYGWINDGYVDIGRFKAVIAVGSGPSLKKNQDYLKVVSLADGTREFEEQDFILMCSNHQLKACFDAGIIPHFAMVSDGAEALVDQMDVGDNSRHTTLIANVITHPKVIEKWRGPVKFIMPASPSVKEYSEKLLGEEIDRNRCITSGGNIMNFSFALGLGLFRASVWMCVGNDLSFPAKGELKDRRKVYYADGDYRTNIISQRDEARNEFVWGGFKLRESNLWTPRQNIQWDLEWRYTASQLFFYKSWLETNCMILWEDKHQFHVYNCTEGGILGVLLKEEVNVPEKYDEKFDPDNWFLMDEVTSGRWRTRTLWHACEEFHDAKEKLYRRKGWERMSPAARFVADSAHASTN